MSDPDLIRVAALMERFNVECVLVGGQAARVHRSTQGTSDVDTVARWTRANLEALSKALDAAGAEIRTKADPGGDQTHDVFRRPPGGFTVEDMLHMRSFRVRTRDGDMLDVLQSIPMEPGEGGAKASYDELLQGASEAIVADGVSIRVVGLDQLLESKRAVGRKHDLSVVRELEAKHPPDSSEQSAT